MPSTGNGINVRPCYQRGQRAAVRHLCYASCTMKHFLILLLVSLGACAPLPERPPLTARPGPEHIVVAIEENRPYSKIIGSPHAPYINELARRGALFSQSYAVARPSQPNYLALFSGSTQGVEDNRCSHRFEGENLASVLRRAGLSFAIYSESLPRAGYTGCVSGDYHRKHNPAVNWQGANVRAEENLPFSAFPSDYAALPTISFVVPDQANDMHDGPYDEAIARGDAWLKRNLDGYVRWAEQHNSLFVLTFDEDDGKEGNRIATLFIGPMVRPGVYAQRIDHYAVLRALLDLYGLPAPNDAARAAPIDFIWKPDASAPARPGG